MRRVRNAILATAALALAAGTAFADGTLAPASERYAADTAEAPGFQEHVLPVMSRLGCNGRACHGSFQGQGGFQLSLFGYDFQKDHDALTKAGPDKDGIDKPARVDRADVDASLILRKGAELTDHGGGQRMEADGWEYNLLRKWIEAGAQPVREQRELRRIAVTPERIQFDGSGKEVPLRVVAEWADGGAEDVTVLCRFSTNDESVAEVDEDGLVYSTGKGDTHVVAFYDNGIAVVPVIRPVTDLTGDRYPQIATRTRIDELVVDKLRLLGMVPSDPADDATFLRRVSVDMTGTLPLPSEIREFLADGRADKRDRKIDELLRRPAYAAWWATRFADTFGVNERFAENQNNLRRQVAAEWYEWLRARIERNEPYDRIVEGMLLAVSRQPEQGFEEYSRWMSEHYSDFRPENAVGWETMPHFFSRTNMRKPEEKALGVAHAFLGVRLQCAQCHKHPFDQWTQNDFNQFAAFFGTLRTGFGDPRAARKMTEQLGLDKLKGGPLRNAVAEKLKEGEPVPFRELFMAGQPQRKGKKAKRNKGGDVRGYTPRVLGGEELAADGHDDPRDALMDWMRAGDNPYFAAIAVNRVWAAYFGVGIVDPVDDLNLANPPSNRPLLDYLTGEFVARGYDLKWLHREIAASDTYQRSWQPNETNDLDRRNFSRAYVRRLPAEVLVDATRQAVAADETVETAMGDPSERSIMAQPSRGNNGAGFALNIFGKPTREVACDCERSDQPNLIQSLYLRNDFDVHRMIADRSGWIAEAFGAKIAGDGDANGRRATRQQLQKLYAQLKRLRERLGDDTLKPVQRKKLRENQTRLAQRAAAVRKKAGMDQPQQESKLPAGTTAADLVEEAYLRTVSRLPEADETAKALAYIQDAADPQQGTRDLLWALMNTKEFIVNH